MRNIKAIAAGSLIGIGSLASAPAMAGVDASAGISTAYIFRGVSFGQPQVWGGLDYSSDTSSFYAGTWISSESTSAGLGEEVDLYAGFSLGALDLGYLYYWFPGPSTEDAGASFNNSELYAGYNAGGFSGYVWYNLGFVDGAGADDSQVYLDFNYDIPIAEAASIGLHFGYTEFLGDDVDSLDAVYDWGLTLNLGDFYIAATASEEFDGAPPTTFPAVAQRNERPRISAGYSWSFGDVL